MKQQPRSTSRKQGSATESSDWQWDDMKPDLARIWIGVASDSHSDTDPCLKESETESLENDEDNEENLEEDEDSNESDPQSF